MLILLIKKLQLHKGLYTQTVHKVKNDGELIKLKYSSYDILFIMVLLPFSRELVCKKRKGN